MDFTLGDELAATVVRAFLDEGRADVPIDEDLVVSDVESDILEFRDDLGLLERIDLDVMPALPLGDGDLVPLALRPMLARGTFYPGSGIPWWRGYESESDAFLDLLRTLVPGGP